ncbi:MAG: hypothetical protein NUV83_01680 [Candidatus Wolfebacteria bacterium]|nr:hypothetical protein [Candidatus Wolfebacteria bacterium]
MVGFFVDVIAIPIAIVANVNDHQKAMEILGWSDDVKTWLRERKPNPLSVFLAVAGFVMACVGTNIIWSAWHIKAPMYVAVEEKIGFAVAGGFVYLTGLILCLAVFRKYFRKEVKRGA